MVTSTIHWSHCPQISRDKILLFSSINSQVYINSIYLFKIFLAFCPFQATRIPPWAFVFHSLPLSCDFTATSKTSRLISLRKEQVKPNIQCNLELASHIPFDLELLWSQPRPVCGKGSALSQEPGIHYFEKVTQTSYVGTDFPLVMIPICHLFLILCVSMSKQSMSYTDYKWNSCTIQQLATVFPYFQGTQTF